MKMLKLFNLLTLLLLTLFLATSREEKIVAQISESNPVPSPETACDILRNSLDDWGNSTVLMKEMPFDDLALGLSGLNCQLTLFRESTDPEDHLIIAEALKTELMAQDWQEDPSYVAYGPNEISLAFSKSHNFGMLDVGWQVAVNPDCTTRQPTPDCQLNANHRLYTVTFKDYFTLELLDDDSSS